ncbi:MAG: hypothetical protein AB8B80_05745 [Marinicellaceae bacterium]
MGIIQNIYKFNPFFNKSKFKLVYLHIEKSAGTSQRIFFYENFNHTDVFWYGIDSETNTFLIDEVRCHKILGGHRFIDFYNNSKYIYLSVIRDPIPSVLSLFNYFITQENHKKNWFKKKGFDPLSFENTLINCPAFRNRIENHQCRYFGKNKSFVEALKTIKKFKFVLGCLSKLELFNQVLFDSLNISQPKFPKVNVAQSGYQKDFNLSQSSMNVLNKLVQQDRLLYDYIINQYGGLYNNVNHKDWNKLNVKPH